MSLKLRLFGPPNIEYNGRPIELNLRKGQALLAFLVVEKKSQSRDALAAMFWPDSDQSSARASLRRTLYQVNKALDQEIIQATAETMFLARGADIWVDTAVFRQKAACLDDDQNTSALSPACFTDLTKAAALQSDTFLSGFALPDCPNFDEWQFFQQESLRQIQLQVLKALINHHTRQREYDSAIKYGQQWLNIEPWHETAHRALMILYSKTNQKSLALHQFEQCRRLLEDEFGIQPEPETVELYEKIKLKRPTPSPAPLPVVNGLSVVEEAPAGPAHNIPYQLTPFVGRQSELTDLDRFIANPAIRLISIIGPGGMGKTRLALALGQSYLTQKPKRFPDGIFHVPLSPLTETGDILPTIAGVLNIPLSRVDRGAALAQLQTILHSKKMLLILDNFEHLLEGANLVLDILEACPQVTILITSRERLYLKEEHLLVIKGLDYPGPGEPYEKIAAHTAVELFVQCVRRNRPAFTLDEGNAEIAAHICGLVAGMPLALELAASWTDMLPLSELAQEIQNSLDILETELRNIPDRQRSIRAVFAASWQRLNTAEQEICAQLSFFRGGFTRQAAQQIAIAKDGRRATLQMLSRLADKSLIQYNRETRRYQVHELLRQYGAERLEQMSEIKSAVETRFHNFFAAFLYDRRDAITSHVQGDILRQITAELDNIRLVWRHSLNPPNLDIIRQTYYTLYEFSDFQGYFRENINRIEQTVAALKTLPQTAERDETLAVLYTQLGYAYVRTGPLSEVEHACRESLALFEKLGIDPPPGFGTDPRNCLGLLANILGQFSKAQKFAEETIAIHNKPGHELNLIIAYYVLNDAVAAQGDYEKAFEYAQKAYQLTEQLGHRWMMGAVLIQLGNISRALNELDQARDYYQSSYDIKDNFNDPEGMAAALNHLGNIAWLQESYHAAESCFRRALAINRNINDKGGVAISLNGLGETAVALENYDEARQYLREGLEIAAEIQFTTRLLSLLAGVARLYLKTGNEARAAEILPLVREHPATNSQMGQLVEGIYMTYQEKLAVQDKEPLELIKVVEVIVRELGRPTRAPAPG